MSYSLEEVRSLFEQYNLYKADDGVYVAMRIGTKIPYDDEVFVEKVKFAHTWFAATRYDRSLESASPNEISPSDYEYAFGPNAKRTYDYIMEVSSNTMQASGRLIHEETLEREVVEEIKYKYASSIVKGLYSKENFQMSFANWVRMANNLPMLEPSSMKRS